MKKYKLLFIHPSLTARVSEDRLLLFPMGLGYLAASLKKHSNHSFEILDLNINHYAKDNLSAYINDKYKLEPPDFFLIGSISSGYKIVSKIVQSLRAFLPNIPVIVGGVLSTLHSKLLIEKVKVDVAVIGEAEETLIELLEKWDDIENCAGIALLKNGQYFATQKRDRIKDLNKFPMPYYEAFETEKYIQSYNNFFGYRGITIIASRGCPYKCKFCFRNFGNAFYLKSPENTMKEIIYLVDKHKVEAITFYDELFFLDKKWIQKLCRLMKDSKIKIKWSFNGRVNLFSRNDLDLLKELKKVGLTRIVFGIESADQKVLDLLGKDHVTPSSSSEALRVVRDAGIKATGNFLIGAPNESPTTIGNTVQFCKENVLKTTFYVIQPFPGTELFEKYLSHKMSHEEYLNSLQGRTDASTLQINLTEMSDEEFLNLKNEAEKEINKLHFLYYLKYYRIRDLPKQIIIDLYREFRRYLKGAYYQTP